MIVFDEKNGAIVDTRGPAGIVDCAAVRVKYTLDTDDITSGDKPSYTPYADRTGEFDGDLRNAPTRSALTVERYRDGLKFVLKSDASGLSEYGINLPLNFMGKKNGGGWRNQFTLNSPYRSPNGEILYFYLAKPSGNNWVIAAKGAGGFKIDYSPYCCAHFIIGINIYANYDRVYGRPRRDNEIEFVVLPVKDFDGCMTALSAYYGLPFVTCSLNGGVIGDKIRLKVYGKCDTVKSGAYTIAKEGDAEITPVCDGKVGATATVYGYKSLRKLYDKSMAAVDMQDLEATDKNLCEHQCWATAMLRYLLRYKSELSKSTVEKYEKQLRNLLDVITTADGHSAVERLTIFKQPHDGFPAYNVYKSTRVQEGFFGVTLLMEAYTYFKDEKYREYATGALDCLLDHYTDGSGAVIREDCDYTTVCCPMITIVDAAKFTENTDKDRSHKYFAAARRMAEHLYRRGLQFPTEGEISADTEDEMEDGSISCTALALLYYCKNVERNDAFIRKAKEILDVHDCWVMQTPIAQMHGSTVRWWETLWEGDADGPALCCGHAWSIWRAEADELYYELTGDESYLVKAKNGFLCNLAKIHPDGKSYSIYSFDEITGGGFARNSGEVKFRIAPSFPDQADSGLTRYVWIRLCDTFLK